MVSGACMCTVTLGLHAFPWKLVFELLHLRPPRLFQLLLRSLNPSKLAVEVSINRTDCDRRHGKARRDEEGRPQ